MWISGDIFYKIIETVLYWPPHHPTTKHRCESCSHEEDRKKQGGKMDKEGSTRGKGKGLITTF